MNAPAASRGRAPEVDEGDARDLAAVLRRELRPTPGRLADSVRIVIVLLIVVAISETFRLSEIALSGYIVLFLYSSRGFGGTGMKRFVEGQDRSQLILLPDCLDDYVGEDNPVRIVDAFIDELDLAVLGFAGVIPEATGRPSYHPVTLLKIYLYGYLNRVQSSRRLERETQRNIELMWLTGRLAPDFKTIADFRRDNGEAIRAVCSQFVVLCRRLGLFTRAVVAIDGSKFKAVNNRDKNFTVAKLGKRIEQVEASIVRYLAALDRADREESDVAEVKSGRLKEKIAGLRRQMQSLKEMEQHGSGRTRTSRSR